MTDPRVTAQDVQGLRLDTSRLADSIDGLAARQVATDKKVDKKADTSTVREVQRLAKRARVNSTIAGVAVLLAFLAAFVGWRNNLDRIDQADQARSDAKVAVCNAYNKDTADRVNGILLGLAAQSRDPATAERMIGGFLIPHRRCDPAGIDAYYSIPQGSDAYEPVTVPTQPGG